MKKVFQSKKEISHLWASQAQSEARNPQGSFYFEGLTIYSYGSHFPIAQIWHKNNNIVFFNSTTYSNTTSKHQRVVSYAINHKTIIKVPIVNLRGSYSEDHLKNIQHFVGNIRHYIDLQSRARIADYRPEINRDLAYLNVYVEIFRLKSKLTKLEKSLLTVNADDLVNVENDFAQNVKRREELKRKKIAKAKKESIKKAKEKLKLWMNNEIDHLPWYSFDSNKVYLRYNKETEKIESSKGAKVPIKEAKVLFKLMRNGKDIKGFKIGSFTVISYNGTLKIGCHEIEQDEIQRMTKVLNWES
jgi:hypothetical protein